MKKIPTLFKREFEDHRVKRVLPEVTEGLEYILKDITVQATVKWNGACCAIINGELYKRYDAKNGKKPPEGAIPCQEESDPVTGHFPHWVKVDKNKPEDKWFVVAYDNTKFESDDDIKDGTYEAVGPHFQSNPYDLERDRLKKHGQIVICDFPHNFEEIREYLRTHYIEGVVFWKDGEPKCKIKRTDFGFKWGNI